MANLCMSAAFTAQIPHSVIAAATADLFLSHSLPSVVFLSVTLMHWVNPQISFQQYRTDCLFLLDLRSRFKWTGTSGVLYHGVLSSGGKLVDRDIAEFL